MEEYEYDFAYECRRLVEAMAPRSARSFRQEFNMQDLTTEHTYTTHYTTENRYVRTSHSTELDGQPVKSMANGKLSSPSYTTKTTITDDDRPDVRKLKRVHRMYEGPNIIESRGIVHPETREILTVGQAISMRILDVRTGRLLSSPETRQTMSIDQAAQEGLIDPKLAARLTGPCGMTEDGNEVTLLEAIQRELYDAEQGFADPAEKRIKVTVEGESTQGMSISDALNRGQVDLQRGLYRLPNGSYITIAEAYQRGYLIYNEIIKIKSSALCLSDAISQDLVDNSGWILDRNSGDRFQLDVAIKNELINPNVREVVDAKTDTKITLAEAIERNIINTKHSKYVHNVTKEKLSFKDAASNRFICKPMTLKDVCDNNLMTNDGKILSPANRTPLNLLEAINVGVLDSDSVKCITNTTTGGLLTLSEALAAKIILTDNKFRDNLTGEICTIPEAVDRGLITSVSQRSIFDIDGFKDPKTGEFVSFNVALSKGNLKYVNGETFLKSESGDWVYLEDCTKVSLVRPEVLEMFNRKIGVYESGKELSVLDAVFKNVLDPKTGHLLDATTKKPIPFNKAVEINMITPEGAALLNSLLNITLTLQTVTKTVKRYVTVTNTSATQRSETIITFAEAIRRGLIDEHSQTFTDPTTGTVFPIQQALDEGLLGVEKNEPRVVHISDRLAKKELVPGQVVELKITKKSYIKDLPPSPEDKVQRDSRPETVKSPDYIIRETSQPREGFVQEIRTVTSKSVVTEPSVTSMTIKKNTIELPYGGWSLKEAIQQGLFDPATGMFIIPGTDRILDLEEALKINLINADSAIAIDPKTRKEVPLNRALEYRIIDSTGRYRHSSGIITMKEAIERKYIIYIHLTKTVSSQKIITITSVAGMPDKMEISEVDDTPSHEAVSEDQSALEPVQVTPGVIFDPATALVISTTTGVSENVVEAVDRGLIPSNTVKVIHPQTGRAITLKQAIDQGIVDKRTGEYKDRTGNKISLVDAAKVGLVAVIGAPLVAASKVIQVVKSTMVVDPQTGEKLPMEVAYERGLVDPVTYRKYEESIRDRSPEAEVTQETKTTSTSSVTYSQVTTKTIPTETTVTVVVDPNTGEKLPIDVAYERGLIDPVSYKKYELSIREKTPEFAQREIRSPTSSAVTFTQVPSLSSPDTVVTMVVDPKTGEQLSIDVAYERGIVDPMTYKIYQNSLAIKQPQVVSHGSTVKTAPSTSTVTISQVSTKPVTVGAAVSEGFITVESIQNSLSAENRKVVETVTSEKSKRPTDVVQITKTTISSKPKYKVNIGRERTPETEVLETKPVVLQKLRKRVVTPLEAVEIGLIDKETAKLLEAVKVYKDENGALITLEKAIERGLVDENKGKIIDPIHRDVLTIKEALKRGILDGEGQDEVLIPLARSLTIPEVLEQGLLDPATGKIVHPETGNLLTLREAIICDIVDPLSSVTIAPGKKITLAEAIERNIIDNDKNVIKSSDGPLDLISAVNAEIFPDLNVNPIEDIPRAAMTLNIAIKKNLINPHTGEMRHPLTGEMTPVGDAVKKDLIMAIPYPQSSETISLEEALDKGIVNLKQAIFIDPKTKEVVPLDKALEQGLLAVKPITDMQATGVVTTITETFTSQHTVTTKMIELLADYVLVSSNEIQNTKTGEIITIDEARRQGIVKDEQTNKEQFITNDTNINFEDALNLGYINIEEGTFTHPKTGETVKISEAVSSGVLNTELTSESTKTSPKKRELEMLDLNEAFELLFDEKTQKFRDPKAPNKVLTFKEALDKKIINPESVIYNVEAGKPVTLKEALNTGLIDKKTGKLKEPKTGKSIDVKNAAKMGLIAVVAAPVLAGMAVVQGAKAVRSKIMQAKQEKAIESPSRVITTDKTMKYGVVAPVDDKMQAPKQPTSQPIKETDKQQKAGAVPKEVLSKPDKKTTIEEKTVVTKVPEGKEPERYITKESRGDIPEAMKVIIEKKTVVMGKETPKELSSKHKPRDSVQIEEIEPEQQTSKTVVTKTTTVATEKMSPQETKESVIRKPEAAPEKSVVGKDKEQKSQFTEDYEFGQQTVVTETKTIVTEKILKSGELDTEDFEIVDVTQIEKPSPIRDMEHVVYEEKPVIQEYRRTTPDGEEVVTVVKTTVTKTGYSTSEQVTPIDSTVVLSKPKEEPSKDQKPESEYQRRTPEIETQVPKDQKPEPRDQRRTPESEKSIPKDKPEPKDQKHTPESDKPVAKEQKLEPKDQRRTPESEKLVPKDKISEPKDQRHIPEKEKSAPKDQKPGTKDQRRTPESEKPITSENVTVTTVTSETTKTSPVGKPVISSIRPDDSIVTDRDQEVIEGRPVIQEFRQTTPDGEVTTIVKTIVSKSEPSTTEYVTEHSSTVITTSSSTVRTVEISQNESTSYQVVTEEYTGPQEITESNVQDYQVEFVESPDEIDKAQTIREKVSPDVEKIVTITKIEEPTDSPVHKDELVGKDIKEPKKKQPEQTPKDKTQVLGKQEIEENKPLEVAPGVIYDPNTSVVISASGTPENLLEAVNKGIVPSDTVKVIEPKTGKEITLKEAINKGVVDSKTGQVKDKSGKKMSIADAAKIGLIAVVGAPIFAAAKVIEIVKSAVVVDPKTGEKVPLEQARERGLVDPDTYRKYEEAIKAQKPEEIITEIVEITESTNTTLPGAKRPKDVTFSEVVEHHTTTKTTTRPGEIVITQTTEYKPVVSETTTTSRHEQNVMQFEKPTITVVHDGKTVSAMLIDAEKQPLRVIDEITEQNVTREKTEPIKPLYENIPLIDAIAQGKIEPKVCRIVINGIESPLTVQDSLEQEQISRFAPVDVISKNCVIVREFKPCYSVAISHRLTPEELSEMGVYDIEKQIFLNPETGAKISFEELVYGLQIFDPELILVKDLGSKSDNYISFDEAIARPIIDKTTGHMVNPKTGKRVPFLKCIQLGWIVEKPEDVSVPEQVTIESALEQGLYNPKTGEIKDVNTGALVPIGKAIEKGLIDQESLLIKVPRSNEVIPIYDAIERGIIEIHEGIITIVETSETIEISIAIQRGLITIIRRPISIEAVIVNELYESKSGKIKDKMTDQLVTVGDAVDRNIVHPTISEIKDTALDKFVPLAEALDTKLINPETGKIKDKKTGKDIPLDDALKKGLVATKAVTFSLFDIIELGYYSPESGKILNPKTGQLISLQEAIKQKLVDPSDVKIKDDKSETVIPFDQAVKTGLVDLEKGIITTPLCNLKDACDKGYLLSDKKPWTLQEGLVQGFYDPETGLLTINNVTMTLEDAIKIGNINPEALTVRNSVTGEIISLADAIKFGIIDSKEGKVRDPIQGDKISLTDASERGLIVPAKRKLSLPEAVFKGFYDPKTGKFSNPHSKEKIPTDRAIKKRLIDPQSTLVHVAGKVIPFEFAVDRGIIDSRTGTIRLGDENIDFREAFERGILVEVRKPLSLIEALEKGVYNEITGLFMDPQSGKKYTLVEAIRLNLIDAHSVHILDNRLGKWDKITLPESLETGVIDEETGKIRNINNDNEEISLRKAFEIGLLVDSKAPISLQRALHQGLYDDTTGKIIDPATNRKITLHETIRRSIISPKYLCYFDKKSEKPLSLAECCRSEIIDRRSGKFHEPGSDVQIPLSEAMSLGLIVDIESAGFTLYDTLAMNMYNITELVFVHPVTERKISLKTAVADELIHPETSLVKHIPSSKYIKLTEAIQNGTVDEENNVYVLPNGNQINLLDAKHRGLVVTTKKNLSLEEIIRNGLFRADNGKIVDPSTNEFIDINKATEIGLLNPDLTIVKDNVTNKFKPLSIAIQQGDVDVGKGRVLDTKAKKTYSLDIAFDKGLLVTVIQPITSQTVTKRYVSDTGASKEPVLREFTLDEAIKYEFIDPETAVIKDPHKNKYIPLKLGITEGIIDKNAKGSFDTQNRARTLCFVFENGLIVYVREPLTFEQAIEDGHLNVSTARFTDPHSNEVLTIKDAAVLGYIDPDTALIKDNLKKRLVKLPEAFRKGLMDAEKGNILDTETSKLNTLTAAIENGLLMTPKKSFTLIETLNFGIYNPTTGALNDPFITTSVMDRKRLNLGEAIQQGIVDPSSTVVKEPQTGKIWPLVQAIEQKLVDPVEGRLTIDPVKSISLDLVKALKKGYLLPAETRQAVEEKYRLCDETLSKLLEWIAVVEERLANQEAVKEDPDELRNQINILKLIKDDLEGHQRQVSACADQAKQLLVSGGDVLAPHEVAALERGVRQLKQRCDKCTDKCDKMLRRLAAARDELGKFSNELNAFNSWMESAYRSLEDKEASLSKLNNLAGHSEHVREFVSDVIAHQADLRFITMSAQKFVDESKEFLSILNEYRTSLPSRLSHIPPSSDSAVREGAALARRRHAELCARAQRLQDRLRGAADVTRHYHDAIERANRWIKELEPQVRSVLSEPVGGEPRAVESQLSKAKTLHNEILAQGRLIDNAKDACDQLVKSLEGNLTPSEIRQLEVPVIELTSRYNEVSDAVGSRCAELEAALLQCQGLQDAAETQAHWLGQAETVFKNQQKPASLIRERLDEQVREQRISHGELDARRPTLAKLLSSARDAALTPSNARIAKKLEQRAEDIYARYEKLVERSIKRVQFLDEVSGELAVFTGQAGALHAAHAQLADQPDARDLARMPHEQLAARLSDLAHYRDKHMPLLEECLRNGKQLIAKKDVTDTHVIRDKMKALENQWRDFNASLEEKQKLSRQRADQLNQYESLKIQVLEWLLGMESRVTRLQPVAVEPDVLKQQLDELRPLAKEYRDFSINIDKVNEAGAVYEALTRGERADSPHRKRQLYSPTKRQTPSRTLDARSPSPSKGHGLVSPGSTHSTSSGFSSRRSSQDGFHLEELSPVQQQLSEINNRYSLLGTKLADRQSEIDAIREEVRKHLESLRALNTFLDKVQRQLPKESVPNTKEEADKTIRQARAVLEEMYEKQSILDSTKTQVRELLKRKQSVLGADRLHDEMEDVSSRWRALHDAFKDKIRLMEEIKDFHDTHTNLAQWLGAKDRMMAALGPISSDSRMVQTQVQQVQVLREEFRGQQPQLAHLEEVAGAALARLDPNEPDAARLQQKVVDLQDRWNDLLDKLEKRAESLGAAADTSREFDAGLTRLRDALQTISDKLDDVAMENEPEDQLRKIENLERQLEGQRPLLADLEGAGAALSAVLADPAARQDIATKLAAVVRQYDNLQRKLDHRKAEIENALKDGRNLEENVARTLGWLQSELGSLPGRLLVSADSSKLQQQLERHEPLYRDLTQREHELIMLLDKGREMEKKPAHQGLRKDLDRIQTQWDKLKRETVDRQTRLQTAMEHCRKFHKAQESFVPWLGSAEERLAQLPAAAFTKKEAEKQLRELQHIRNDIWKRSGEYENNKTLGETFISACDTDQEVVRKLLDDIKARWDRINNEVLQQVEFLESTARKLGEFAERVRAVETPLQRCEERLEEALAGSPAAASEAVARLTDQIHALRAPLQSINAAADDIVTLALECNGPEAAARARHVLEAQAQALGERLDELEARAGDAKGRLAGAAAAMTLFQDKVKNLSHDLTDLEKELDTMKPPGRDIKTVKQQLDDIGRFYKRLEKADDLVGDTERAAEVLVDSGYTVDTAKTRDQVEGLRKQLAKLDERARSKEQDLDDTLSKLEAFYKAYDSVMDDVQEAAEQVRSLKPVSSEVEQIRAQQKDFAELKRRTLEPVGQNVGQCNKIGQGLVRSALQGVNTQVLEKDLEKMNDRWNALKEKMNERERRLDVGLLQSGKFAEALAGLEKWLADTEDMVNNQKPPSADYKVVKAQLQEQKFLKKMLMDRQNSMSSLFAMGNEVAGGCEPAERKAIEKQLKGLMTRFDALTDGAQQRMLDLEQAMMVAKQFEEELQPLVEWLSASERRVKALQLVPTDEEKIQLKIRESKALHDDILSKQPPFKQLTETASTLMGLVGDDEATALADRLQAATDRYQSLVDHSLHIGELLESSRKGLRHLVLTYQDLSAWMDSMEQFLAKRKLLPVHMDKLLRQMEELAKKTEEIATKHTAVDSTVESGLELMKHISGDEALQLKDKLDALQRRYNDLTERGARLLQAATETLPLVRQLHDSHDRLTEWMSGAESCLQSVEPREEDILRLEAELHEYRPLLENINLIGPQLCQISPGEGATYVESIVTRDNRRFDAIAEQVQRKAERLLLSKKRSLEVVGDMEEVLEWLRGVDSALRSAEPPSCEASAVRAQLKEQRPLSDDVAAQRVRVRDLLSQAKKVLRECQSSEETAVIRDRSEELKEMMEEVGHLSAERLAALEQALPLAEHFADTHHGLSSWLDDMEKQIQMLAMPALRPEQIAQQQDKNEMLQQSIAGHKPLVDKLVKTGEALSKLCGDDDAAKVQDIVDADCERYNALRAELRQRQQELEQALQESSQFSDKLEGMLRALAGAADQLQRAEPVSAHPPKIEDQIEENNALVEDLEKRQEAYNAVQRAASDVISKANKSDPAVRDIRNKLDKLHKLWDDVQKSSNDRGSSLDSTLEVARKFWEQLNAVMATLGELEDTLTAQPPPAAQPRAIQAQQVALQEIRHEIDHTKPEVEKVRKTGSTLMSLCGEPDKPEVKKHMEDLDSAWDNITALYARREENLIDAMEKAMEFHDTLQNLQEFLDTAEEKFSRMGPLGSDIDAVKRQIAQLASFKQEVDPHMVKVEALNRQAQELTERTSSEQAAAIKAPLTEVNSRWSRLLRGMVERQQQLERALLRLGQLQHALQELLTWIQNTSETLDTLKPVAGDPQVLEVELAKLKVLVNDIAAHQASVDTLNDAGAQIVQQGTGTDEAGETAEKLATLNRKWRELQQKARDRQSELEDALREAQSFNAEIGDLLSWLSEVDGVITASKPVGGLPETATEQLERFMEVYNEIEANRPKVEAVLQQGQEYLKRQDKPNPTSQLHHNLKNLKSRWDNVTARASDKKIKLEIALKEATEFHDALQAFVDWLTSAEKTLTSAKPVSRVMETLLTQIEEHKSFQKEVGTHRETMLHLDKKGTHLKYFSQKQDVILIKNLLVSVQHRWERVVSKAAERTRALDHGFKEAKEFSDMWNNLMNWLNDTEKQIDELNSEATVNDPEKIKQRLQKHREFQKALAAKQPAYDQTMKTGKQLKDKAPKGDEPTLKIMLADMKTKWTTVCSKAVDRQRKLEEALLYSGQFKDAMSALLEWLKKQQKQLAADSPVHGDLDTVMALIEQHKQFEEDLHSREQQMQSVMKTGKDLEATVPREDAASIRTQCSELKTAWEAVHSLSENKAHKLETALKEAEKLHRSVNMLLEWLSDAETKLRFSGQLPEGDQETQQQILEHERFVRELNEKQIDKDETIALAHSILGKAHPDAVTVIKHWITIIQSRWDEVWQWAMQRGSKLDTHMQSLKDLDLVLEELLQWLTGLENTLHSLEAEPLPESIELLEGLIEDHKELMEHTQKRQNEVDRVCKAYQVKSQSQGRESTPRKVSAKTATKGTPARVSPGRETPDRNLPHYGPRFPPKGSKGAEPEFRSPRVKLLWDKWRTVWLLAWERQRRLHERLVHLKELQRVSNFSWDDWRKRFLKFMNHKKSRLTDLFRKMDKDNNGLIARHEFIDGIMNTKFDTSRLEMGAVADLFDRNGGGLIDWEEFIAALRPDWVDRGGPPTDADKIHDEVKRLVMLCTCRQKFRVFQVGEGKYRFGDSQKLRLVRILRSTVMVRVGGGWVALDEFLVKNDPCRAKGRTNIELREQFILADGVSQSMAAFRPRTPRSNTNTPPSTGPITKVRERTARSVPMSGAVAAGRASRSSLSAGTPDSLSDNEAASGLGARYRKPSAPRSALTPGGSRPGSRPGSRAGSKPPSRHGSNLSLDSTDDVTTPSRIPMRKVTNTKTSIARAAATASKLGVTTPNGGSRPRTPTGYLTPASGRQRTPSGSTTPVRSGQQTAVTRLLRKPSDASDAGTPTTPTARRGTPASSRTTEKREPFRL